MPTDAREHTPGPWVWSNATGEWMLVTPDRGRLVVLNFVRKGMQGAAPRVRDIERCLMLDFDPDHPDARLIAAAPLLLDWVKRLQWGSDDVCPACCQINPETPNAKRIDPDDLGHEPGCEIAGFLASLDAAETEPAP